MILRALAALALSITVSRGAAPDIVVYGATPGGIAAAIAAGKSGCRVVLLDPTARIGGLLTSGLSHTDFHSHESLTGTFLDFTRRVKAHYVDTYGAGSPQVAASFEGTFGEPKVNLAILHEMLAEYPNIQIETSARLASVAKDGPRILSATFDMPGGMLTREAKVFVDGSYEGDLMAMAGVPYHVGREGRDAYGESLAPGRADSQLQAYNFRLIATDRPENRAEVKMPEGYLRDDFLDLLPILGSGKIKSVFGYPGGCIFKAQTPALPNGKYDVNDVSRGLVRLSMPGHNLGWPEGDPAIRREIFDEHRRYNVGLLYFLQNDGAVPARFREMAREWGWCLDEFTDTDHLPPQLYVREARRMDGRHIFVQADSEHAAGDARAKFFADAIAIGDYGNNCHGTGHEGPVIGGKHTGEFYNPVPPYQIPYGVISPRHEDAVNLLVPVAASSSHVGFCALRLEPIWTSLGQAAGFAAAMASDKQVPVQEIPVSDLQAALHGDGSATIYTSDVSPAHPDFAAVQWWGLQGAYHGLHPHPEKPGQRGERIHGQYFQANPGHGVELEKPLDPGVKAYWLDIARSIGVEPDRLSAASTRGEFIRAVRQEK